MTFGEPPGPPCGARGRGTGKCLRARVQVLELMCSRTTVTRSIGAFRLEGGVGSPNSTRRLLTPLHPETVTENEHCGGHGTEGDAVGPAQAPGPCSHGGGAPCPSSCASFCFPVPPPYPPPLVYSFLVFVSIADVFPVPPGTHCQCPPCNGRAPTPARTGDLGGRGPCVPQAGLTCPPPLPPPLSSAGTVRPQPRLPKPTARSCPSQGVRRVTGTAWAS